MEKINYSLFLENYLDGEMKEAELKWFKKELENNPELQKELLLRKEVNAAIAETDIMELRRQLQDIHAMPIVKKRQDAAIYKLRKLFLPVAAILVLAIITIAVNPLGKNYTNQELFHNYYSSYDAGMSFRGTNSEQDDLLQKAYDNYRTQHFEQAIQYFETALSKDNTDMASTFYAGMSYMEIRKFHPAQRNFNAVINENNSLYVEQAEWYLGLCYLASDNRSKAAEVFSAIAKSDNYFAKQARKILKDMN